jgi:hypothetical protein
MYRALKEDCAAASDLAQAIDLDSSLEASLKPMLEGCRAAADKKRGQNP